MKIFAKVFAKIFHSECGSGSHLNVYPDPNIGGCNLQFSRKPSREQTFFAKTFAKKKICAKTFANTKIFAKRNFVKFCEKWANFRLFSFFAKMKKGVFVSTLQCSTCPCYLLLASFQSSVLSWRCSYKLSITPIITTWILKASDAAPHHYVKGCRDRLDLAPQHSLRKKVRIELSHLLVFVFCFIKKQFNSLPRLL
jgi:hypothetical protein